MAARKTETSRAVAPEWRGFPGRLRYAVNERIAERPGLSQNEIAASAGVDSGNFSKYMSGEKVVGVTANTVIMLARALRVRPAWLLLGEEPSGLQLPANAAEVSPGSERRQSSRPR
jgi:transcriptional regulator with XRE-family HTH domain